MELGGEMDIKSKIREAEIYHSMGLLEESLGVYEGILSGTSELDPSDRETIGEKIHLLKQEIKDHKEAHVRETSTQDPSITKKTVSIHGSVPEILDSASALKELGLIEEAIAEYKELFHLDYPTEKVIPEVAECFSKIYSPFKIIEHIEGFFDDRKLSDPERAKIKFMLGHEMEKRGNKDLARELYRENKDTIDMVLLDMVMPNMGGGQTYDRIKEINPHMKVLLSSDYSINGEAAEILDRGCEGFIQKPFNMRQLSQSIREILDKK